MDHPNFKNLRGRCFGRLTVIECAGQNQKGKYLWDCRCECGGKKVVIGSSLTSGNTTSCGCYHSEMTTQAQLRRHTGHRDHMLGRKFGRLTIESVYSFGGIRFNTLYFCNCECGNIFIASGTKVTCGDVQSCGCLKAENKPPVNFIHGLSKTRLYSIWNGMIHRCYDPDFDNYAYYGGRKENPVSVYQPWKDDFLAFYYWAINSGYSDDLTIDRINGQGNYEPKNCRWVTHTDQARNKKSNVVKDIETAILIRNDPRRVSEIADHYGISKQTIYDIKSKRTWKE